MIKGAIVTLQIFWNNPYYSSYMLWCTKIYDYFDFLSNSRRTFTDTFTNILVAMVLINGVDTNLALFGNLG
jgi:hypothetical protein